MSSAIKYFNEESQSYMYDNVFTIRISNWVATNTCLTTYVIYDVDEELFYIYGKNLKIFHKSFKYIKDLYNCLNYLFNFDKYYVTLEFYHMDGLPEECNFYNFNRKTKEFNKIVTYDSEDVSEENFFGWMSVIM